MNTPISIVWNPNLSSAQANAIVTVGPPPDDFSPNIVPGLAHWWRADSLLALGLFNGQPVSGWVDLVGGVLGSQPNATLRPTFVTSAINNRPAVQFDSFFSTSISQRLSLDAMISIPGDFTTFAVLKVANFSGAEAGNDWFAGSPINPGIGVRHVAAGPAYNARMRIDGGSNQNLAAFPGANDSQPHLVTHRRTTFSGVQAFFNNASGQGLSLDGNLSVSLLGAPSFGFSQNISLIIAEILHFSTAVSDGDMASLYTNYFKPRYALP
jgi:hypothetical protein